jgi:hypothetical protein
MCVNRIGMVPTNIEIKTYYQAEIFFETGRSEEDEIERYLDHPDVASLPDFQGQTSTHEISQYLRTVIRDLK